MDKRQITNYVNFTALILYIIGRVIHMGILCWIGLGIMTLDSSKIRITGGDSYFY